MVAENTVKRRLKDNDLSTEISQSKHFYIYTFTLIRFQYVQSHDHFYKLHYI